MNPQRDHHGHDSDAREGSRGGRSGGGMKIAPRFAIATTLVLAVVLISFSFVLLGATRNVVEKAVDETREAAATATLDERHGDGEFQYASTHGNPVGKDMIRLPIRFRSGPQKDEDGFAYVTSDAERNVAILTPKRIAEDDPVQTLYALFFALTGVALFVTAGVAFLVAGRVSRPIQGLVDDVRMIANGNLSHRCRSRGGGEVGLLAGAIDRMTASLREAQDAEVELSVREREREVAMEVQEALRSAGVDAPEGYVAAAEHVGSDEPGGDFFTSVQMADGRTVYLVCDVSGTGVPGALVGAMTRAYLKSGLADGTSLEDTLRHVNKTLAKEIRRGMYVTALAAALEPASGELEIASAGHKIPLIHFSAADGKLRSVSPDGIALGFDKGPVFDRSITTKRIELGSGDRILMAGTGAVKVVSDDGDELGEKRLYKLFGRNADDAPEDALDGLLTAMEAFAGETPFPVDVTAIVLGRA